MDETISNEVIEQVTDDVKEINGWKLLAVGAGVVAAGIGAFFGIKKLRKNAKAKAEATTVETQTVDTNGIPKEVVATDEGDEK